MNHPWLRLWTDMPNDPKWRTIARVSGQSIGNVMAVYLHVLVDASNATERGRTQPNSEDIATALDVSTECVQSILEAMQGRVMDGEIVCGWAKRQPAREDGSAERAKAWREAQKQSKSADRTQPNAGERNRTLDKSREEEIREEKKEPKGSKAHFVAPDWIPADAWRDFVVMRKAIRGVPFTDAAAAGVVRELRKFCDEGFDATELLQNAVMNSWRTVYRPKHDARPLHGGVVNKQEALEERNRAGSSAWAAKMREQANAN